MVATGNGSRGESLTRGGLFDLPQIITRRRLFMASHRPPHGWDPDNGPKAVLAWILFVGVVLLLYWVFGGFDSW